MWTLPDDDADFSMRWRLIKSEFSRRCRDDYKENRTVSRVRKGEQAVWQRRFWEHQIRDERDFANHVDYIHFNPVSHGLVAAPKDWQYSSFQGYICISFDPKGLWALDNIRQPNLRGERSHYPVYPVNNSLAGWLSGS